MSADIGRATALMLAIILLVFAPITILSGQKVHTENRSVQHAADKLSEKVERTHTLFLSDYEELLTELARIGTGYEVELRIGKKVLKFEDAEQQNALSDKDEPEIKSIGTMFTQLKPTVCGAHAHTQSCYVGHNHAVNTCVYHEHTSACYCAGKLTHVYKTDSGSWRCGSCGGSGTTGTETSCSGCSGTGQVWLVVSCAPCSGSGRQGYWAVCGSCGGSGTNSKGNSCKRCGGTGCVDTKVTCGVCGGSGIRSYWANCSACHGAGKFSTVTTCSSCNGAGGGSYSINYYNCDKCGQGSTTSYGQICGKKQCSYVYDGYQCGLTQNDTRAVCDKVITDVSYSSRQEVYANDPIDKIDRNLIFTCLNGQTMRAVGTIDNKSVYNSAICGRFELQLSYEGYYLNAQNYTTNKFNVNVTVKPRGRNCEKCGNFYYYAEDGSDTGCPYCYKGIIDIRIELLEDEYEPGETIKINVYAVYDDCEEQLDPEECWDTFDSSYPGTQTVIVGYGQFTAEVCVIVKNRNGSSGQGDITGIPSEQPGSNISPTPGGSTDSDTEAGEITPFPGMITPTMVPGNGIPTPEAGTEKFDSLYDDDTQLPSPNVTILQNDEILERLSLEGNITLNSGDEFSVIITKKQAETGIWNFLGNFTMSKFTAGTIIGN